LGAISCAPPTGIKPSAAADTSAFEGSATVSAPTLIASLNPASLGVLEPGSTASARLTLRNPNDAPIAVKVIETSCPCVLVTPPVLDVNARNSADVTLTFDPSNEPDFRGGLSIDVVGKASGGAELFRTKLNLEVRAPIHR
jgi:hypothetical protein